MSASERTPARSLEDLEDREALEILHATMIDSRYYVPKSDEEILTQDALVRARINRDTRPNTYGHAPVGKQLDNTEVHQDIIEQ